MVLETERYSAPHRRWNRHQPYIFPSLVIVKKIFISWFDTDKHFIFTFFVFPHPLKKMICAVSQTRISYQYIRTVIVLRISDCSYKTFNNISSFILIILPD